MLPRFFAHSLRLIIQNCFHLLLKVLFHSKFIAKSTYQPLKPQKKTKHFGHCDDEKSLSVLDDAKKQKMRRDVKLLYDVIGRPSDIHKNWRCEFAARYNPRSVHALRARFAGEEIINSLHAALRVSLCEEKESYCNTASCRTGKLLSLVIHCSSTKQGNRRRNTLCTRPKICWHRNLCVEQVTYVYGRP